MKRCIAATLMMLAICRGAVAATPATAPSLYTERHLRVAGYDPVAYDKALEWIQQSITTDNEVVEFLHTVGWQSPDRQGSVDVGVNFATEEFTLTVDFRDGDKPSKTADEVADRLIQIFKRRVDSEAAPLHAQIDEAAEKMTELSRQIDELSQKCTGEEANLRHSTGAVDVSPVDVRQRLAALQMQRESAGIELAAKQARSDALTEQISKYSQQIQEKIKADPIAAELAKVVDVRQKEFERRQQTPAGYSKGEVEQAMGELAEAKAKLLERQETAVNAAGGDTVAGWNRELMTLTVDLAELRARSKALDDRLAAYVDADDYLNNADQWLAQLADLRTQLATLHEQEGSLQREYDRKHVAIEVVKDSTHAATQPSK